MKQLNHICQTVPVHTAADMTEAAVQFCRGELSASGDQFLKQDNISQTVMTADTAGPGLHTQRKKRKC